VTSVVVSFSRLKTWSSSRFALSARSATLPRLVRRASTHCLCRLTSGASNLPNRHILREGIKAVSASRWRHPTAPFSSAIIPMSGSSSAPPDPSWSWGDGTLSSSWKAKEAEGWKTWDTSAYSKLYVFLTIMGYFNHDYNFQRALLLTHECSHPSTYCPCFLTFRIWSTQFGSFQVLVYPILVFLPSNGLSVTSR
jgi:hypothetical protein